MGCRQSNQVLATKHKEVPHIEVNTRQNIGKGDKADVFLGDYLRHKVAVKQLRVSGARKRLDSFERKKFVDPVLLELEKRKRKTDPVLEQFMLEAVVMNRLHNRHIIQFFGLSGSTNAPSIVVEYMSKGCLLDLLRQKQDKITQATRLEVALGVGTALVYLEKEGIVHRDIAARNVLLNYQNGVTVAKLSDFGLCIDKKERLPYNKKAKLPHRWLALEGFNSNSRDTFTSKSDVWSFGVLLWEIWTNGKLPYGNISNRCLREKIVSGVRLEYPRTENMFMPAELFIMCKKGCWANSPQQRRSPRSLLNGISALYRRVCPNFNAKDYESLTEKQLTKLDKWVEMAYVRGESTLFEDLLLSKGITGMAMVQEEVTQEYNNNNEDSEKTEEGGDDSDNEGDQNLKKQNSDSSTGSSTTKKKKSSKSSSTATTAKKKPKSSVATPKKKAKTKKKKQQQTASTATTSESKSPSTTKVKGAKSSTNKKKKKSIRSD